MAKAIMIQGTASNAGKSILCAALCRIFRQDGYRVAPFKAQNMALNSYITADGLEMGRAQVMQAEASGIAPDVRMNPILLKPTSDVGSQVIVNGSVLGNRTAKEYWSDKRMLRPIVKQAYDSLANDYDIIVIEGAGSPAEINLKQDDLVNMGMAELVNAPVILVGDIDRGGVFASLYGTIKLLEPHEQARIQGLIINKFRGDLEILRPGLVQLETLTNKPVLGVIPYTFFDLDDEDSLSERLEQKKTSTTIHIGVIRLPHLSNFTDLNALSRIPEVAVHYISKPEQLSRTDFIIIPGTKSTLDDLKWLRTQGIEAQIIRLHNQGIPVLGICGGYQMMGRMISDPYGVESGGELAGMGILPVKTVFQRTKTTTQIKGTINTLSGTFSVLSGAHTVGYEVHMGDTHLFDQAQPLQTLIQKDGTALSEGCCTSNACGTYLHGFLDEPSVLKPLVQMLFDQKGFTDKTVIACDPITYKNEQYDLLANTVRTALDMQAIYRILK